MATQINLGRVPFDYDKNTKTFAMSELHTMFATTYEVFNPKSGKTVKFDLSHSTGSEWDPKTRWVYKSADGELTLEIAQDYKTTQTRSEMYLDHKLNRD